MPFVDVDVVLVGGGVASARCARTLRRNGFDGSILVVGDEPMPPYNRPPLSKELLRGDAPEELLLAEPSGWYARQRVELRTGVRATDLDPAGRRLTLEDGAVVDFERCLLATGAVARALPIPGGESALLLRTVDDARRIQAVARLAANGAAVVVIGGGLIGVEVAGGLASLGLRPTLVGRAPLLWSGQLGELLAGWAADRLREAGVELRLNSGVDALDEQGAIVEGAHIPAAFVVAGVGARPRDELAVQAGLLESAAGIPVDDAQRTGARGIWAAGDVTRVDGRAGEHWHAARESGERAALSMLGLPLPRLPAPWVFTEVAGAAVDVFGETDASADEQWIDHERAIVRSRDGRLEQVIVIGGQAPIELRDVIDRRGTLDEVGRVLGLSPGA